MQNVLPMWLGSHHFVFVPCVEYPMAYDARSHDHTARPDPILVAPEFKTGAMHILEV